MKLKTVAMNNEYKNEETKVKSPDADYECQADFVEENPNNEDDIKPIRINSMSYVKVLGDV